MALLQRLEVRQSQSLVMTPQLMQAIKLLQLSNLDLVAYVEAELERNPLLERADEDRGDDGDTEPAAAEPAEGSEAADGLAPVDGFEAAAAPTAEAIVATFDTEVASVFPDDAPPPIADPGALAGDPWSQVGAGGRLDGEASFPEVAEGALTLHEHLERQLALATGDLRTRLIGQMLIDAVDEAGYLRTTVEEVAARLGATPAEVGRVLALVQSFEPTGVAARDLAECLALQLRERDRLDPAMQALLQRLDLLAKRDYGALRRHCGVEEEDLADMVAEIRRLDPKPGNAFGGAVLQPVVPDVIVRPAPDGSWQLELNSETLPKVLVNRAYASRVARSAKGEAEKHFLSDCLQTANWLVKSLDQRATTILKVATEIVRQQDGFLLYGVAHLRPLTLRLVADAVGLHESTVSRVTANKYMATPRGILELKYFFTSAIAAAGGGEAHSSEAVRHRIKELIDAEDPRDVLSDDTLVKLLRADGIDIARRTVAKYREALHIPSSVQRRREKLMAG